MTPLACPSWGGGEGWMEVVKRKGRFCTFVLLFRGALFTCLCRLIINFCVHSYPNILPTLKLRTHTHYTHQYNVNRGTGWGVGIRNLQFQNFMGFKLRLIDISKKLIFKFLQNVLKLSIFRAFALKISKKKC
jgi:hypothetical protein